MPVHTHTYTVTPGTGAAAVGTQGGSGTPVYGTVATDARGGGYSHTNVQPSLVVNAIIGI
jgi:microcystin-dependent protein